MKTVFNNYNLKTAVNSACRARRRRPRRRHRRRRRRRLFGNPQNAGASREGEARRGARYRAAENVLKREMK